MIQIKPTTTGIGVSIKGPYDDFHELYDLIGKIDLSINEDFDTTNVRHMMLMAFNYDVRHAFMDADFMLQEKKKIVLCELKYTWADIIFYFALVRHLAAYTALSKADMQLLDALETGLKEAMKTYDPQGAEENVLLLEPQYCFDTDALFLIQHEMHNIHLIAYSGKRGFRKLPYLVHNYLDYTGIYRTAIVDRAKKFAKKLNCRITDLDSGIDYIEVKKW